MIFRHAQVLLLCVFNIGFAVRATAAQDAFELKARFAASVVFSSLPEDEVRRLIGRSDLKLDSKARGEANAHYSVPSGHYPVIFLQGVQSDMTDMQGNIFVANGRPLISYHESVFLIPRVQFKGRTYNYMRRLYLDRAIAVMVGRQKHGYDKMVGEFKIESGELYESALTYFKAVTVADFRANPLPAGSGKNVERLFSSLIGENFVSFSAAGGGAICTRQAVQVVKNSLYPIRAEVIVNKGYFNDGIAEVEAEEPLYRLDGSSSSLKLVYDWKLTAPDVGCTRY